MTRGDGGMTRGDSGTTWWTAPGPSDDAYTPDEDLVEAPTPWRAAAPTSPTTDMRRVVLDAYDDELTKDEIRQKPPVDVVARREQRRALLIRLANLGLFALAVVGAAAGVAIAWMHVTSDPLADAHAYYEAAARLNAGGSLYPAGVDPSSNHIYLYPPLFAIALRPLALLPYEWFALVWELLVIAAFVLLLQRLGVRKRSTWIAVGLLGIPIGWALSIAQAHVPMTLLMAIGQPWSIALAANLKLFPALIALYWLGRREFESLLAFLVWSVLFIAVQVVVDGPDSFAFFRNVGFGQLGEEGVLRNISPFTLSPIAWLVLLIVGCIAILAAARSRWGWAVAVSVATLAPPRLLVYMLTGLLAAVRRPKAAGEPDPDDLSDPAAVYVRSAR
jgi:hypothetical protein